MTQAVEFVMSFYGITWEDAVNLYWDEVEAYLLLSQKLSGVEE